ncbi:hypothetical protein ACFWUW_11125 [Streptomyces sp. NPDC058655]|uniref:hypothetical protein n=1 Tax=Streptomyces sp. NPDC058655 TaxID=3346577 RepID=UPI00365EF0FA
MDAQRGNGGRRRFLLALGLPLFAVAGAGAAVATALRPPERQREPLRVRTDLEPLDRRFRSYLGELSAAHWVGYDVDEAPGDRSVPSPDSRIRLAGVAHLPPGGGAAVVRGPGRTFAPAVPSDLPAELRPHLPEGALWQHSAEFDAGAAGSGPEGHRSGTYLFDAVRDLVCFDVLYVLS